MITSEASQSNVMQYGLMQYGTSYLFDGTEQHGIIGHGVDVKVMQYEENARTHCEDIIDLHELIETHLFKRPCNGCCMVINLEKDYERYLGAVEELKKISIRDFRHVKGTYWKNREQFQTDMSYVLSFLQDFTPIKNTNVTIDEFSSFNDENIHTQDGPLACFCSHLRAMIYGFTNAKDYTIIMEDDVSITNTQKIKEYLAQIPDDWDIICMNAMPKRMLYKEPFYKFIEEWHSTHFYIVNNKRFPFIFQNMYPITDQVDVMLSNLIKKINIYNLTDTVYQKNIATNTQNNLHVIFNSPHYDIVRKAIGKIEESLLYFVERKLNKRDTRLVASLMYDVLFDYVLRPPTEEPDQENKENFNFNSDSYHGDVYDVLIGATRFFLRCTKKGVGVVETANALVNTMLFTIDNFNLHNEIDPEFNERLQGYDFGASAHVYLLKENNVVVKKYNDKLRWVAPEHKSSDSVFSKELYLLQKLQHLDHVPKLISSDGGRTINMEYKGESLYHNFNLPDDWQEQIKSIFAHFSDNNIVYPEFRLQNILVLDGKISFVDFGLARFEDAADNTMNRERFITLLGKINDKFKNVTDQKTRYRLCCTFFKNLEL